MYTTNLRKVGGSVMLTVPPALLEVLKLKAGASVGIDIEDGRLVVAPQTRPHYHLKDLLAESVNAHPRSDDDQQWVDSPALGRELL